VVRETTGHFISWTILDIANGLVSYSLGYTGTSAELRLGWLASIASSSQSNCEVLWFAHIITAKFQVFKGSFLQKMSFIAFKFLETAYHSFQLQYAILSVCDRLCHARLREVSNLSDGLTSKRSTAFARELGIHARRGERRIFLACECILPTSCRTKRLLAV